MLLIAVATIMLGSALFAQDAQAHARSQLKSTIAVTVDSLTGNNGQGTIPALSWSFGASRSTSGSTGARGHIRRESHSH